MYNGTLERFPDSTSVVWPSTLWPYREVQHFVFLEDPFRQESFQSKPLCTAGCRWHCPGCAELYRPSSGNCPIRCSSSETKATSTHPSKNPHTSVHLFIYLFIHLHVAPPRLRKYPSVRDGIPRYPGEHTQSDGIHETRHGNIRANDPQTGYEIDRWDVCSGLLRNRHCVPLFLARILDFEELQMLNRGH